MAVSSTLTDSLNASLSRNLGTISNSILNSTLGTAASSSTMNQVYSAWEKLNASIETVDKTIDYEALTGRNKPDDLYTLLAGMDIQSSSDFMNQNREFRKRLERLNRQEKDITLDALGVNTSGKSNVIDTEHVKSYTSEDEILDFYNDYNVDYVQTLPQNQRAGDETTIHQLESSTHYNYSGLHNDLYAVTQNYYPDDENRGTFANKWIVENRNSLMYKTKKLFNSNKINTIISAFHTRTGATWSALDNAKSKYGLSHGRNLLRKEAENGYSSYYVNGYDNPYCRVWTHHHKYHHYYKTIRPFSTTDNNGNYDSTISVEEFHGWSQFADEKDTNPQTMGQWGWKKSENNGWKHSVLRDNGMVNITPKYLGGEAKNIHTKQCMFSIENLAWRGYDPYSFEQALSWEQRGPLGGRIMWFPPYGISFNETTTANWQNNTFLGRGEDVYTYTNTTRTGTLSFMMVVDHPSILDYVTWNTQNKTVTDTDILRFLAGCGSDLTDYATPTPLTDEYTQQVVTPEDTDVRTEIVQEPEITPDETKPTDNSICFYVFYPNNYSGTYDNDDGEGYGDSSSPSTVQAIPYLLVGKGAQKNSPYSRTSSLSEFENDITLNEDSDTSAMGTGYEMGRGALQNTGGFIYGTAKYPNSGSGSSRRYWTGLGSGGSSRPKEYLVSTSKLWYYRIDGRYIYPQSSQEDYINYYNQTLPSSEQYVDSTDFSLNKDITSVATNLGGMTTGDDGSYTLSDQPDCQVFTLAEVAHVLYSKTQRATNIRSRVGLSDSDSRVAQLMDIIENADKDSKCEILAEGYASSQGYVTTNTHLAENRAKTAASWTKKLLNDIWNIEVASSTSTVSGENVANVSPESGDSQQGDWVKGDCNAVNSKKWRYAKVTISFQRAASITATEATNSDGTDDEQTTDNKGRIEYVGYSPANRTYTVTENGEEHTYPVYTKDGKDWYKKSETNFIAIDSDAYANEETSDPVARYGNGHTDENRLRYDQEYHFFQVLKQTDPVVFDSLMDKLKYFDPAFHSMTPEGFNGRLTFLQQCMRQGNTVSASDKNHSKSANNLAFGRAPVCVLRLGDFFYTQIIIDNLQISYDPLLWDLNVEGIGVQPLLAHVQLSFKFIGGEDITSPIRRLQNAMSFNYYANGRLYDNRADRVERKWSDKTNGAIEHDEILSQEDTQYNGKTSVYAQNGQGVSTFYTPKMYK